MTLSSRPADRGGPTLAVRAPDSRHPLLRLRRVLDPGALWAVTPHGGSGVSVAKGTIHGKPVIAYCTDAAQMGGALGTEGCRAIAAAIDAAVRDECPVVGLWHSGGARLAEGVRALDGVGMVFAAMIRASGRVPQISVVLGPAAGGAAYGPALTDIVIMSGEGKIFVTGPDVVRAVTGEQIDMDGLGGPEAHGRKSGVAHVVAATEADACHQARRVISLLTNTSPFRPPAAKEVGLRSLLPDSPRRAYDVTPLIHGILDGTGSGSFVEMQPRWAPNMVTGLGLLTGATVGVIANNPIRKGGCLDSLSAEKAARFVRMCDSFGIPLLVLVDVPGYLPGVGQEWGGVVRRGAKLLHAFGEARVPRVTVITRKSYGGAYVAMNSRALGATRVFAWPEAEVAVMGAEAAVRILHRRKLASAAEAERPQLLHQLAAEHARLAGGVGVGLDIGVIDEVIVPDQTRAKVAEALASVPAGRGSHGNIPL